MFPSYSYDSMILVLGFSWFAPGRESGEKMRDRWDVKKQAGRGRTQVGKKDRRG